MNVVITPNMSLPNPVPGVDPGIDYANNQYSANGIIDGHNHSAGSGVQIQPNGLNINAALPFQNNPATGLQACSFTEQSSNAVLNTIFVGSDGNLYFNDGAGDASIKITSGGVVNATSSGIAGPGSATASFVSSVLVVNQAANTPASIQAGTYLLGQTGVSGSNYLSLVPPSSLSGGGFTLTLPSQPGATSFLQIDASGNITAGPLISGGITTSNIAAGTIVSSNIAAGTIVSSNIASATITGSNIAATTVTNGNLAGSIALNKLATFSSTSSLVSGSYTNATTSYTNVISVSVTGLVSGRPVFIYVMGSDGYIGANGSVAPQAEFRIVSGGGSSVINSGIVQFSASGGSVITVPPSSLNCFDSASGSVTYSLQGKSIVGQAIAQSVFIVVFQV